MFGNMKTLLTLAAFALIACGAANDPPTGSDSTAQALDNETPDPDDGKACYQDVPMRKGKMSYGVCCFDDPIKGTSECITCDAAHTCTKGGAEPGALTTGGFRDVAINGNWVVVGGSVKPPRNVLTTAAAGSAGVYVRSP